MTPTAPDSDEQATREELLALERERCRAIVADDLAALRALLSDRLIHVHTRGNQDSLESYLAYLSDTVDIVDVQRGELRIELHGDCAVVTGAQINTARPRGGEDPPIEVSSQVMQVWVRGEDGWRMVAFQATPTGAPPPPLPR